MEQFMIRRDPAEVGRECLEMERCGLEIQLGEHGVGEMCRCGQERGILVGPSWLRGIGPLMEDRPEMTDFHPSTSVIPSCAVPDGLLDFHRLREQSEERSTRPADGCFLHRDVTQVLSEHLRVIHPDHGDQACIGIDETGGVQTPTKTRLHHSAYDTQLLEHGHCEQEGQFIE